MKTSHVEVMFEDLSHKFDLLLEAFADMRRSLEDKASKSDVLEIKTELKIIRAAVTQTSKQVDNHEFRITTLEAR
jgi:hypothetical protein